MEVSPMGFSLSGVSGVSAEDAMMAQAIAASLAMPPRVPGRAIEFPDDPELQAAIDASKAEAEAIAARQLASKVGQKPASDVAAAASAPPLARDDDVTIIAKSVKTESPSGSGSSSVEAPHVPAAAPASDAAASALPAVSVSKAVPSAPAPAVDVAPSVPTAAPAAALAAAFASNAAPSSAEQASGSSAPTDSAKKEEKAAGKSRFYVVEGAVRDGTLHWKPRLANPTEATTDLATLPKAIADKVRALDDLMSAQRKLEMEIEAEKGSVVPGAALASASGSSI